VLSDGNPCQLTGQMRLMPRPEGWGVKASDLVSELCGLTGIKNISIKVSGDTTQFSSHMQICFEHACTFNCVSVRRHGITA
jgi:ribosomal protein S5